MIVKAISHKSNNKSAMKKLINYCFNPDKMEDKSLGREKVVVKKYLKGYDISSWIQQFKSNDDSRIFQHKKRTVLRHEIISFSPLDSNKITKDALEDIGKWYLKNRTQSLGACTVHWEKSIHLHFVIAGVGLDGTSTRVSRKDFKAFKVKLQEYQREKYPELNNSIVNHVKKKS